MYSTMMWLLIFQRDFSNSMGKKKPNLRLARVNPCRRLQPRWRTCYVGARRSALCTTSGFSCLFPSCVHPSPRWLQRGAQPRHWVAAHEEALPITRSCCRPNNNTETSPPTAGIFLGVPAPLSLHAVTKPSLTLSFTLPKPWSHFGGSPKARHPGRQWGDGGVIPSVPLTPYTWGSLPPTTRFGSFAMFSWWLWKYMFIQIIPSASIFAEAENSKLFQARLVSI